MVLWYYGILNGSRAKAVTRDLLILITRSFGPIPYLTLGKSSYEDLINSENPENFDNPKLDGFGVLIEVQWLHEGY